MAVAIGIVGAVRSTIDSRESAAVERRLVGSKTPQKPTEPKRKSRSVANVETSSPRNMPLAPSKRMRTGQDGTPPWRQVPEQGPATGVAGTTRRAQSKPTFEPAPPVSVPCARGESRCVVQATVNGTRLDLVVDTGAEITLLWDDAASRAGLSPGQDAPILPLRGVAGGGLARLVHGTVDVGGLGESGILMAVMPGSGGHADGLLGMTYLGRFRTSVAADLRLQPLDAADPNKIGGHGKAYWKYRFRDVAGARAKLERMAGTARDVDRKIEAQYGIAPGEATVVDRVNAVKAFVDELDDELWQEATRNGVPKDWRR